MLVAHQVNRPLSPTITCHRRSWLYFVSRWHTAKHFCYHLALKLLWWTIIENKSAAVFVAYAAGVKSLYVLYAHTGVAAVTDHPKVSEVNCFLFLKVLKCYGYMPLLSILQKNKAKRGGNYKRLPLLQRIPISYTVCVSYKRGQTVLPDN